MMLRITPMTVARKPGHRGEREGNRKAIAQGMPVETGEPVEDYRILCGHGCIGRPAFPAPSYFWGGATLQTSGASCRENAMSHPVVPASEPATVTFVLFAGRA